MSNKEAKRQKKRAKTKKRLTAIAQRKEALASASGQMLAASSGEILHCQISSEVTEGMRTVLLTRCGPNGMYGAAFFLLDLYCLGVKDCGLYFADRETVDRLKDNLDDGLDMEPIDPSTARAIVEGAVSYAASLGLPPHNDYRTGKLLWGNIPVGEVPQNIQFGKDGKPFYIAGPHDNPAKQTFIMNCLATTAGQGQFDDVLPVGEKDEVPTELLEFHESS